jgi:hyperosmotically inducible periplasmic protein
MRRHDASAAVAALALSLLAACASAPPSPKHDDAVTRTEILAKLSENHRTNPFAIDVKVSAGVAHLTGRVADEEVKALVESEARSVEGVKDVVNELTVGMAAGAEPLDDDAVTARVKAKLAASAEMTPLHLDVATEKGVVTLSGRVASDAQKTEAERIARATQGVVGVRNLLEVGGSR